MQQTKMSRSEVVRRAYELASNILTARANDGTVEEMLMVDDGLEEDDATRINNEIRKIGQRLHYHTINLKG